MEMQSVSCPRFHSLKRECVGSFVRRRAAEGINRPMGGMRIKVLDAIPVHAIRPRRDVVKIGVAN